MGCRRHSPALLRSTSTPWLLAIALTSLACSPARAIIFRAVNEQCGGLGGSCVAKGSFGLCADAAWSGNSCVGGSTCTSSSSMYWACVPVAPGTGGIPATPDSCLSALKSASPGTTTEWIDPDTPSTACYRPLCTSAFGDCNQVSPPLENMVLVFSDEFEKTDRNMTGWCDPKWHALDLNYVVNGDVAGYKPDAVTLQNGSAVITVSRQETTCPTSGNFGEGTYTTPFRSGMLQTWNKFCYTGGYLEVKVKLPGDIDHTGLWPAVWMLGNLGRAGFARSTNGLWPYSFNTCAPEATGGQPWSLLAGQRMNACNSSKGRGATEIDMFEVGIWNKGYPVASTSVQAAPLLPPKTHWLDHQGGMFFPTSVSAANSSYMTRPNDWWGANSYPLHPRPGTQYQDAVSANTNLDASFFQGYRVWGVDWAPGKYVRWYIDGVLVFEANAIAFQGATNSDNQTCADRQVPNEPMYIIMNVAMSNEFTVVDPTIPLPATMEIDYVRLYQSKDRINIGCNPPDYPTTDFVNAHIEDYYIHSNPDAFTCALPAEESSKKIPLLAIIVPCVVVGTALLAVAAWCATRSCRAGSWSPSQVKPHPDLEQQMPKKVHGTMPPPLPQQPHVTAVVSLAPRRTASSKAPAAGSEEEASRAAAALRPSNVQQHDVAASRTSHSTDVTPLKQLQPASFRVSSSTDVTPLKQPASFRVHNSTDVAPFRQQQPASFRANNNSMQRNTSAFSTPLKTYPSYNSNATSAYQSPAARGGIGSTSLKTSSIYHTNVTPFQQEAPPSPFRGPKLALTSVKGSPSSSHLQLSSTPQQFQPTAPR